MDNRTKARYKQRQTELAVKSTVFTFKHTLPKRHICPRHLEGMGERKKGNYRNIAKCLLVRQNKAK